MTRTILVCALAASRARDRGLRQRRLREPAAPCASSQPRTSTATSSARSAARTSTSRSILSDPNADPHLFEPGTKNALAVAQARLVIQNGVGYDAFMSRLEHASPSKARDVITIADVLGIHGADANPHLWYDVPKLPEIAAAIAAGTRAPGSGARRRRTAAGWRASTRASPRCSTRWPRSGRRSPAGRSPTPSPCPATCSPRPACGTSRPRRSPARSRTAPSRRPPRCRP